MRAGKTPSRAARVADVTEQQLESLRQTLSQRRRELGLSMSDLARQIGVSPSLIGQIERGQSLPSVATLFSLAAALGADVEVLFGRASEREGAVKATAAPTAPPRDSIDGSRAVHEGGREELYVVRADSRPQIDIRGGVRWEQLTPRLCGQLEFLELVYEPHAESADELYRHPGFEMILVLEGRFDVHVGFEKYTLYPGDSIAFPSSLPHRYVNPGDEPARAVTAILHEPIQALGSAAPTAAIMRALQGGQGPGNS